MDVAKFCRVPLASSSPAAGRLVRPPTQSTIGGKTSLPGLACAPHAGADFVRRFRGRSV